MGLFSVVSFAANAASRCAGAGTGVVIVPTLCTLFNAGSGEFSLNLDISAKEMCPLRHCTGLVFRNGHDESARVWILA